MCSYNNHFPITFESFVFRFVFYDIPSLPNSSKQTYIFQVTISRTISHLSGHMISKFEKNHHMHLHYLEFLCRLCLVNLIYSLQKLKLLKNLTPIVYRSYHLLYKTVFSRLTLVFYKVSKDLLSASSLKVMYY